MSDNICEYCTKTFKNVRGVKIHQRKCNSTTSDNINTFVKLYEFLQKYEKEDIIEWLSFPWTGKDKQESLLRLFASLNLIDKLDGYVVCKGNFNKQTITPIKDITEIFYKSGLYTEDDEIYLGDSEDSSDLTCIKNNDGRKPDLLITTSKNLNKSTIGKLNISHMVLHTEMYKKHYNIVMCIVIRDRIEHNKILKHAQISSKRLITEINKASTITIDWEDLNTAYKKFKLNYKEISLRSMVNINKLPIHLKLHQQIGVDKTLIFLEKYNSVLWGYIPRSGKSYIMAGTIYNHYLNTINKPNHKYLIITTAPNETIDQYFRVFNCNQLKDFSIIHINDKNRLKYSKVDFTKGNYIIICSKQFLHPKKKGTGEIDTTKIIKLQSITRANFDIRFVDEAYNGGTTHLSRKILETYSPKSFTIQITATYTKPANTYDIPKKRWITWDLEDINLCKKLYRNSTDNTNNQYDINNDVLNKLVKKHGDIFHNLLQLYNPHDIVTEYTKYPELHIMTHDLKHVVKQEIIKSTIDNNYGWSPDSVFLLESDNTNSTDNNTICKFQNEEANIKLWYTLLGKFNKFGVPDDKYPEKSVYLSRIISLCKMEGSGYPCTTKPSVIMAFLPQKNINKISQATKQLIETRTDITKRFEICIINSHVTNNPKQIINDVYETAKLNKKHGVLILSDRQCSLGVTIKQCEIVILLNNSHSFDMIYQMMFRCMAESNNNDNNKKFGFVIDMNLKRTIEVSLLDYGNIIKPELHPRKAIEYIMMERLININADCCTTRNANLRASIISDLAETMYNLYSNDIQGALGYFLERIKFKQVLLSKDEQKMFNSVFDATMILSKVSKKEKLTKEQLELIDELNRHLNSDDKYNNTKSDKEISTDISTKSDDANESDTNESDTNEIENKKNDVRFTELLRHIIPLICILTIHSNETSFQGMYKQIKRNNYVHEILISQTQTWWEDNINSKIIEMFSRLYTKYFNNDKNLNQTIRSVKELFLRCAKKPKNLSQLIDKYLVPQDMEKRKNAEVSTPYSLRQDMLNSLPDGFWSIVSEQYVRDINTNTFDKCEITRVFEPCCGKGGFLIDIIDRFMNYQSNIDLIQNDEKRYKFIVENCLYWADINPTNIYICKLLLDPWNRYKLNYFEGDTLEMDMYEEFPDLEYINIDDENDESIINMKFDAVIGNPPYNGSGGIGNGNTIWQHFVKKALVNTNNTDDTNNTEWVANQGYLLYVHPPGWRKPESERSKFNGLFKLMTEDNHMEYLEIHSIEDGKKIFKCGTRYDWYLISHANNNSNSNKTTVINDINRHITRNVKLSNYEWFPNSNIELTEKLITNNTSTNKNNNKLRIICDFSYSRLNKKIVSKTKDATFKYPLIYLTPKAGIRYMYSNINDKGHFGIMKVIIGESGMDNAIFDIKGEYGMTQDSFAIVVDTPEVGEKILQCIKSDKFKNYIKESCSWSNFRIDWRLFKSFKKDFYTYFI